MARRNIGLALLLGLLAAAQPARAQTTEGYPNRPVRIVQTGGPGSGSDVVARVVAARLAEVLRQTVVVENIANAVVAHTTVARARRDGLTILSAVTGVLLGPLVDSGLTYDVLRDFVPVSQLHAATGVLLVTAATPARTVAEFAELVRAAPQRYDLGNYGHGSASSLQGAILNRRLGLALQAVPYPGSPPLVRDMLAGHICCGFIDVGTVRDQLRQGSLRALAVTGPWRAAQIPDVPTFTELGIPGLEPQIWQGFFVPAGTPTAIVARLGEATVEAMRSPEVIRAISDLGFRPLGSTPEEFATMLRQQEAIWRRIVDETGIRIQ
jgi:tripartite-type tricarboxylate transporter receptor subunit TctC